MILFELRGVDGQALTKSQVLSTDMPDHSTISEETTSYAFRAQRMPRSNMVLMNVRPIIQSL